MNFKTTELQVLMVVLANCVSAELNPDGENVCLKSETYQETITVKTPKLKPASKVWCWNVKKGFRCDGPLEIQYETKPRVLSRTRIVPKCCDGYKEERGEVTRCFPVCLKGCVNGKCTAPEICSCASGYYGSECEKLCPDGSWGENCANACECQNDGECDKVSGCSCRPGWMGDRCEVRCPDGHYGYSCVGKCSCGSRPCDHVTGECITASNIVTPKLPRPERSTMTTTISDAEILPVDVYHVTETPNFQATTEEEPQATTLTVNPTGDTTTDEITTAGDFTTATEMFSNKETTTVVETAETLTTMPTTTETLFEKKIIQNVNNAIDVTESAEEVTVSPSVETAATQSTNKPLTESENDRENFSVNEENDSNDSHVFPKPGTQKLTVFHFIPTLTVLSGMSVLLFLIAARWLVVRHRKKVKRMAVEKEEILFRSAIQRKSTDGVSWMNCTENPVYLSDVDINNPTPVLQTFKPIQEVNPTTQSFRQHQRVSVSDSYNS